jgi:cytochrome oxidase assembly protein ShyY1
MLFGVLLTASLGVWQFNRHGTKQALKERILAKLEQPVLTDEDVVRAGDEELYRKVELHGRFVDPLALTAGRQEFQTVGYGVVQPLRLDSGVLVLVDRGWIPRDGLEEALRQIDRGDEPVTVIGQLRPIEGGETTPLPDAEGRPETWPPGSWPGLWQRLPDPKVDGIVLAGAPILVGEGKRREPLPVDGFKPLPRMTDSLSYAFQWWIFGTVLLVVWGALGVSRGRKLAAPPPATGAPDPS